MSKFAQFKKLTEAGTPPLAETSSEPLEGDENTPENPDQPGIEPKPEKENNMPDEKPIEETEGYKAGFAAATNRMKDVFASEHFEGREASAGKLLTKESLMASSAEDVTDLLADMSKNEPVAEVSEQEKTEAAEEAARKEMREELDKNKNSSIDADGGRKETAVESSAAVWDEAIAQVAPSLKK